MNITEYLFNLTKQFERRLKIGIKRSGEAHFFARHGVDKAAGSAVQELVPYLGHKAAVHRIARQRMADMRHMHPYLMSPARL